MAASSPPAPAPKELAAISAVEATRRHIRGSSLLLVGRLIALAVNFVAQIVIVRYLSKSSYGAFAYALSIAVFAQTIVTFGLDRAVTRFIPIYDEQGDYQRIFGTLALVACTLTAFGAALVSSVYALQGVIGTSLISNDDAVSLLLILIFLSPIQALDDLLTGLFAVFARPRAIFFRRYVLTPGLRLAVVLVLVLRGSDATFLASGYVIAGAVGVTVYLAILVGALRRLGLFRHFDLRSIRIPAREIFSFTLPLLTTDLVYAVIAVSDALLLGRFHGATQVGALRAVQPVAQLNQLVFSSFLLLFTPAIARLFARDDREGIADLYWHTTVWIALISFPLFLITFALANPLTVLLFGQRYESSGVVLMVLSLGYYFQAALGFNGTTLMVFGRLRYIVLLNLAAVVVNLALNVLLIPPWGATGAAAGTTGTLIAHNVLKQIGLRAATGISFFRRDYLGVYGAIVIAAAAVLGADRAIGVPAVGFALAAVAATVVLTLNRHVLRLRENFPEVARLPLVRWLVR
jgi:O-antigen/teichoic acid export membrane protein